MTHLLALPQLALGLAEPIAELLQPASCASAYSCE